MPNRPFPIAAVLVLAVLAWPPREARAQSVPDAVLIEIDQVHEYREPSLLPFHVMEGFELPVLDYVEDMLFAANIEPLGPLDGMAEAVLRVSMRGRASGRLYFEPEKAYLYTGADIAGTITIDGPGGSSGHGEFNTVVERPFRLTINHGYGEPTNAPFREALEHPGGFIEELCYAMTAAWGVESVLPSLREHRDAVRYSAAAALGHVGDPLAVPGLVDALHDDHERVRWEAAWSLGRIGDARAVRELIEALRDGSQDVRWFASWSLRNITGEDMGPDHDVWLTWWEQHGKDAQG